MFKGKFTWKVLEADGTPARDEDGNLREGEFKNGNTTAGLNHILGVEFGAVTQVTSWYCGLIDGTAAHVLAAGDTAAQIGGTNGWTENVTYSNANRVTWGAGAASGASITNASTMDFNINGNATIYGAFIISNNTKSGTSGTLWATGAFAGGSQVLVNGQTLSLTYTASGA